jgi:hypothetical protein
MPSLAQRFSWKKSADLLRYAAFAGTFGIGVLACDQKEGERCEIESDCESGLVCEVTAGNGICRQRNSGATPDGGTSLPDAFVGTPDTAVDLRGVDTGADGRDASDAPDAGRDVPVPVDVPADLPVDVSGDVGAPDATPDTGDARPDQAG